MSRDDVVDEPDEPRRPGRIARFFGWLAAMARAVRRWPALVLAWMRRHLAHVAALAWLAGLTTFVGVITWEATVAWRQERETRREAAEVALKARVEQEVTSRLEGRRPDAGAVAAAGDGGTALLAAGNGAALGRDKRLTGARGKKATVKRGQTVELMDLDDMEKARGGSEAEARQALPEQEKDEDEEGGETATNDGSVKGTLGVMNAVAKARGVDPDAKAGRGAPATLEVPGSAGQDDDDGKVTVKMPPGGMAAWIARNKRKKIRIGDKETLAILQGVREDGAAPLPAMKKGGALGALAAVAAARGVAGAEDRGLAGSVAARMAAPAGATPRRPAASAPSPGAVVAETAAGPARLAGRTATAIAPSAVTVAAGERTSEGGERPAAADRGPAPSGAPGRAAAVAAGPATTAPSGDVPDIGVLGGAVLAALLGPAPDEGAAPPRPAAVAVPPAPRPSARPAARVEFAELVGRGAVEVDAGGGEEVLRMPAAVLFRSETSSDMPSTGRDLLRRVAAVLQRRPEWAVAVVSPAPARSSERFDGEAWRKAAARALEVARALASDGVAPGRLTALEVGVPAAPGSREIAPWAVELRLTIAPEGAVTKGAPR